MLSENLKSILPVKLWGAAERLASYYRKKKYRITELTSLHDHNTYRPHLVCKKGFEVLVFELREKCNVEKPFENFVDKSQAHRVSIKIYYAMPEFLDDEESTISIPQMNMLKKLGIGLMIVGNGTVTEEVGTISCNRRFGLEAGGTLGKHAKKIEEIIQDYNQGRCLDAIRSLCEEVEDATVLLALKAVRKGKIAATVDEINNHELDWATLITALSLRVWRGVAQTAIITDRRLRNSLDNFRDKRNLSDHRKTAKQLRALELQYPEAMHQGIRLLRELVRISNNLR